MIQEVVTNSLSKSRDKSTDEIYSSLVNRMMATCKGDSEDRSSCEGALTLGFTSCNHGEGVTTLSFNVARFCAEALGHDCLFLDVSSGSKTMYNSYLAEPSKVGLRQVLQQTHGVREAIQPARIHGLSLMILEQTEDFVFSPKMLVSFANVLAELHGLFDMVIVDLPPVGGAASGLAVANQLDGVVLVIKQGSTRKDQAAAISRHLRSSGINLVGALANEAEVDVPGFAPFVGELFKVGAQTVAWPVTAPFKFLKKLIGS